MRDNDTIPYYSIGSKKNTVPVSNYKNVPYTYCIKSQKLPFTFVNHII